MNRKSFLNALADGEAPIFKPAAKPARNKKKTHRAERRRNSRRAQGQFPTVKTEIPYEPKELDNIVPNMQVPPAESAPIKESTMSAKISGKVCMAVALLAHNDTTKIIRFARRMVNVQSEFTEELIQTLFRFGDGSLLFVNAGKNPVGVAYEDPDTEPVVRPLSVEF